MKVFSKKKVSTNKYRITFEKDYLNKLLNVHPTICSIVVMLIGKSFKESNGSSVFVDPEQEIVLNEHFKSFDVNSKSFEQAILEKSFIESVMNGITKFDIEEIPEKMNKIFEIIYRK